MTARAKGADQMNDISTVPADSPPAKNIKRKNALQLAATALTLALIVESMIAIFTINHNLEGLAFWTQPQIFLVGFTWILSLLSNMAHFMYKIGSKDALDTATWILEESIRQDKESEKT